MINSRKKKTLKQGTKQHHISLLFSKGEKLSCLDQHITGDTCLHSTVASLKKAYGLEIPRKRLKLPNSRNQLISVTQYYFSEQDIKLIKMLLKGEK